MPKKIPNLSIYTNLTNHERDGDRKPSSFEKERDGPLLNILKHKNLRAR